MLIQCGLNAANPGGLFDRPTDSLLEICSISTCVDYCNRSSLNEITGLDITNSCPDMSWLPIAHVTPIKRRS
jgi:hypothetical protein